MTARGSTAPSATGASPAAVPAPCGGACTYSALLNWAFGMCSAARLFGYLPTMWAIYSSASSGQHSLLTWLSWVGANATMAAWLYERNGRRANLAVLATCGNALMCVLTMALIVAYG